MVLFGFISGMSEIVNETVSVALASDQGKKQVFPYALYWRGRHYRLNKVGLHHTLREGRVLLHVFSVSDGNTFFRLVLNTETLTWKLLEVDDENNN